MANNLPILDGAGLSKTIKTVDNAGVHTPYSFPEPQALADGQGLVPATTNAGSVIDLLKGASSFNAAQQSVTTTAAVALTTKAKARSVLLVNPATNTATVRFSATTGGAATGFALLPGESVSFETKDQVAMVATATCTIQVLEMLP